MIWNLIGSVGGKVLDIVDDVVEDKDEANRLDSYPVGVMGKRSRNF